MSALRLRPLRPLLTARCTSLSSSSPAKPSRAFTTTPTANQEGPTIRPSIPSISLPSASSPPSAIRNLAIRPKRLYLTLSGHPISYDHIFLRDACPCPSCVDPSTRQKLFATTDINPQIQPTKVEVIAIKEGNFEGLRVHWSDAHISTYPLDFLQRYSTLRSRLAPRLAESSRVIWDGRKMARNLVRIPYKEFMEKEKGVWEVLRALEKWGVAFVDEVPGEEESVVKLAERIGCLKRTFYGDTWNVRSVVGAKNIAYTSQYLGLHMDLLYFESPPGIQLLHSLRNRATGGNSLFSDGFRAAQYMRQISERNLQFLANFPVSFHYVNDSQHYHFIRPIIGLSGYSGSEGGAVGGGGGEALQRIDHINWAPPFQAPFEIMTGDGTDDGRFRMWHGLAKEFAAVLEAEESIFETRLEEGSCVLFQNRRALHGRREFDPMSGERWFRGAYVDGDAFRSRLRVLEEKFGGREGRGFEHIM